MTDPLGDVSPNSSGDTVVDGGRKVEADVAADEPSSTIPAAEDEASVPVYGSPIHYAAPKTGYYCVGELPVHRP